MKNTVLLTFIIAILSSPLFAQQTSNKHNDKFSCGTDQVYNEYIIDHPEALLLRQQLEEFTQQYLKRHNKEDVNAVKIIPVVFHVIHNYGAENISDDLIKEQVRIWSLDFQKKNPDTTDIIPLFKPRAANLGVEFRLATIDPAGNCTNGIERIPSTRTYKASDPCKLQLQTWPNSEYFNVWTVASINLGGTSNVTAYAQFPGTGSALTDGIMSSAYVIGSGGNDGRVLTHETGHCFNLCHTWSCNQEIGTCGDDNIGDTPQTSGTFGCDLNKAACNASIIENVQNYMDYSSCYRMFTTGQVAVMNACLNASASNRNNLWTGPNNTLTGVADPYIVPTCAPVCDFHSDIQMVCVGQTVQFSDDTWKSKPTNWTWSFTGGNITSSNAPNPVVQYNSAGNYTVSLSISNSSGSDAITKTSYITVIDTTPTIVAHQILMEGFESTQFPPPNTFVQNSTQAIQTPNGGPAWVRTGLAGKNSSNSMRMVNFNTSLFMDGSYAEYVTPAYSFVNVPQPKLTFDLAYAFYKPDSVNRQDELKVSYTYDCGQNWVERYDKKGSALVTLPARAVTNSFVPTSTDWRTENVSVGPVSKQPNIRFRFSGVCGRGNNIYVDNINLNGTVAVEEEGMDAASFDIYPNPTKNYTTVEINLEKTTQVKMELFDVTGRLVSTIVNDRMWAGTHRFPLNQQLQSGVYFVNMTSGSTTLSKRLIVL